MIDQLCKTIMRRLDLHWFVETGTDKGETVAEVSRWFAEWDPDFGRITGEQTTGARSYRMNSPLIAYPVFADVKLSRYCIHSVDLDDYSYKAALDHFQSNPNIHIYNGSSEVFLNDFLFHHPYSLSNCLFFLDAHWGEYWPLRDEIQVILSLKKFVIVIDDFFVPGQSDPSHPHGAFGFDLYKKRILCWNYVYDLFSDMDVRVFYPKQPNRDGRGWVVIFRGYADKDLEFLKSLDVFEVNQRDSEHMAPVAVTAATYFDGKNFLKSIVPISVLRSMHRVYEKLSSGKKASS